jgi:DNA-binding Lrp family transcriptional regulator
VDATLERIRKNTGLMVLDLPLVRPFNIDLGFALDGRGGAVRSRAEVDASVIGPGDRQIMQALSTGLDIAARPFASLAARLGRPEAEVLERIGVLEAAGVLSRIGIIVRHRALGWRSNAMVVWQVAQEDVARAGLALASTPGITLCYQRRPAPGHWPYTLYAMIHARSRPEAMEVLERACTVAGLAGTPHQVLFSIRCFKQTGALLADVSGAAA